MARDYCVAPANAPKSMQILALLAQRSYLETIRIATEQDTELGEMYHTLKSLFDQVKIIYGEHRTFLSAKCSPMYEKAATIFRMANLATFISSVFTGINIRFPELNDHFIDIFARHGDALSKAGGSLYINLKTQIYLAGMSQEEPDKTKEETLEDLFPRHLEGTLAKRHGGSLSAEEVIFLQAARERYEYLMNAPSDAETIRESNTCPKAIITNSLQKVYRNASLGKASSPSLVIISILPMDPT